MKPITLLLATCLVGCGGSFQDPAPHIVPKSGSELCRAACGKMTTLQRHDAPGVTFVGCIESEDLTLKDGSTRTCVQQCLYDHASGISWNTACIINEAKTCEDIEARCNRH